MKRRYCIFAAQYFPHLGGVERYTYNLSRKLTEGGNEVIIVTSNVYRLAAYERVNGIPVYRIPCFNVLDGRYPVIRPNKEFFKIHRMLRQISFDMLIVNTRFYPHSLYGMMLAKRKGILCITIEHGTSHLSVHQKAWDSIGAVYEHLLTGADRLFCKDYYGVSKACNAWLKHFHIQGKGVIYNSIDLEEIQSIREHAGPSFREACHLPEDAVVITFTGRLLKEKGLPQLLNVMDRLHETHKEAYLFIAGDGDLEEEVARRKTEYILPLGRIDMEQVITLLDESDIFCLPSFSEGFSTSILEAAACRCYVVTTARGGARELLPDDSYGSVIPNNEESVLYRALKEAVEAPEHRKKAVELAYRMVESHFTWDIAAAQVERICKEKSC